jgi:hypothetical protein
VRVLRIFKLPEPDARLELYRNCERYITISGAQVGKVCRREIDRVFGDGYAAAHLDVVTAVVQSATNDCAAARLAVSLTNGLPSRTIVCSRRKRTCAPQGGSPGLTRTGHRQDQNPAAQQSLPRCAILRSEAREGPGSEPALVGGQGG